MNDGLLSRLWRRGAEQLGSADLTPHADLLQRINALDLSAHTDQDLRRCSEQLKQQIRSGVSPETLLVEAYALVRETASRTTGMRPFDVQLLAAIALYERSIVEMQTGEGKTLTAVMPVYLNALSGRGVHVLTFNDYLAQRDAHWMAPIYRSLGLTVAHVSDGMTRTERQQAYRADITYLTAKEAGFDYLRDSLCMEPAELVHRPFHYALVDEADSILIDEARIPLVIAGELRGAGSDPTYLAHVVKQLKPGRDFELEQYGHNLFLTDSGLQRAERLLGRGNLYAAENLELLTKLNCALYAQVLLSRDKDYIVRNGKVELVDEFTGRVADKRHWPDGIQEAVEAKEGLVPGSKGMVMGSIAMQHFLGLYPRLSGMTGTARTATSEFKEFYGLQVVNIPSHRPGIRADHPNLIYAHRDAKWAAVSAEIKRAHAAGQPVLVGTSSVAESEQLAADLMQSGLNCHILNAKNDQMEAELIARAGEPGAITISTNMAGRGVDIKLGGADEAHREQVIAAGGLYVIGTNLHESRRIDDQLRGRAGRQGDPGETRFFISLEDDLIREYEMTKLIPDQHQPKPQDSILSAPVIAREIARGQRIIEGYTSDIRRQMLKYSFIIEQQRRIVHRRRQEILMGELVPHLLAERSPERYQLLIERFGEDELQRVERQITLSAITNCWADYLDRMAYIREGIHLVIVGRQNPIDEFHRAAIEEFAKMVDEINDRIVAIFNGAKVSADGLELDQEMIKGPSSTWTYLVNEKPDQFSSLPYLLKAMSTRAQGVLISAKGMYERLWGKKSKENPDEEA